MDAPSLSPSPQRSCIKNEVDRDCTRLCRHSYQQLCRDTACCITSADTVVLFLKEAVFRRDATLLRTIFDGLVEEGVRAPHVVVRVISSVSNLLAAFRAAVSNEEGVSFGGGNAEDSSIFSAMQPLADSALFKRWFFDALEWPDTISRGNEFLCVWKSLGRFLNGEVLSVRCVEHCLELFSVDRPYTRDDILFARTVVLPFLHHSPDNLHLTDPRLRVWRLLDGMPYFLTQLFAKSCATELRLLFRNDCNYRRVQGIVALGLERCPARSAPGRGCGVTFHLHAEVEVDVEVESESGWREEQLRFASRLLAVDPQPGNIEICVMFLRASESTGSCPHAVQRLLSEMLEGAGAGLSSSGPRDVTFWTCLMLNAAICIGGAPHGICARQAILEVIVRVFSGTPQHLHVLRVLIINESIVATCLTRSLLLGDMYVRLLKAHTVLQGGDAASAWRRMFPDSTEACTAVSRADIGEKVMLHAVRLLPDTALLSAMAESVRGAPDLFGVRSSCLQKLLVHGAIHHTSTAAVLEAFLDTITPATLLANGLGRSLVTAAVLGAAEAMRRVVKTRRWEVAAPNSSEETRPTLRVLGSEYQLRRNEVLESLHSLHVSLADSHVRQLLLDALLREFSFGTPAEVWLYADPIALKEAAAHRDVIYVLSKLALTRRFISAHLINAPMLITAAARPGHNIVEETVEGLALDMTGQRMSWVSACVALSVASEPAEPLASKLKRSR